MKKTLLILFCIMVTVLPLFAGGGGQRGGASGAPELLYHVPGDVQPDSPAVMEAANRYLADKGINARLNMNIIDWGSYDQRMQLIIASQEAFDMCYTANWINNYLINVSRNAFLDIGGLIDQHAPQLKAVLPPGGWDAARVGGRIYAVPNQQVWCFTTTLVIEKAYLDRYNISPSSITDMKSVEPLLAAIKRDNPSMYPFAPNSFPGIATGIEDVIGSGLPGVILLNDNSLRVVNQLELPQFLDYYRLMRQWYLAGYIRPDAATVNDWAPERLAGRHPVGFGGNWTPDGAVQETRLRFDGREVVTIPISDSWMTTGAIIATMTAVSRTSRNPDRAIQYLNLVNTDPAFYNLLCYGIEGRHYTRLDANYIRYNPNSGYSPGADWMFGNLFNAYLTEGQELDVWDQYRALNNRAKSSPALGFSADISPMAAEIASLTAISQEYGPSLSSGSVDPDVVMPELRERLRIAGSQRLIDELQRQLDAWKAAR